MESTRLLSSTSRVAASSVADNDASSASTPLLECQREQLTFNISTEGLAPESAALLNHIKQVAESILYHWKTFPILLPPPLAVQSDILTRSGSPKPLVLRDAFIPPSFDELDAVAVDSKGDPKQLDPAHLSSIRKTGRFSVPSLHFPQQEHVWQLATWLQKGKHNIRETLLDDVAAAAAIVVVLAKHRVTGDTFSLWHSLRCLAHGLYMLLDLVFGVPWLSSDHLPGRLQEERSSHLVQELTAVDVSVESVCGWLREEVRRATVEKGPPSGHKQPPLPYVFVTPQGQQLDLRLYNRSVLQSAVPSLVSVLEKEARGWFLHFREKTVARLRAEGLSDARVEKEATEAVQNEYLRRVCGAIKGHPDLCQLAGPGTDALLCDQLTAATLMLRASRAAEESYTEALREYEADLRACHPLLSRVSSWRREQLQQKAHHLQQQLKWHPHTQALAACRDVGLQQHAYFLQRDLAFMKERAPLLQKELQSLKTPAREFQWRSQIMAPERYIVRRTFQGTSETIPTILSSVPTSITAPRSPHQPGYVLHKQVVRTTSTRWPLWRVFNAVHRSYAWACNAVFLFGLWVPLCSPLSLRALCSAQPFMPDYELSQVNGAVCPSRASLTPTLAHRLHHLWRRIAKARTHFETTPDTGFIGKGMARHLNRLYNYVLKGVFGTLFYVLVFPVACVLVSLVSILVALLAPVWVPCAVVVGSLLAPLVYDFDAPLPERRWLPLVRALLGNILLQGLLQPLLLLLILLLCPVLALLVLALSVCRYGLRSAWDWLVYEGLIRKRGRVPAADSCLVRRVAGPGLHHHYCYQVSMEQSLAALEARLELELLAAHQHSMEQKMARPLLVYEDFIRTIFGPFSGGCGGSAGAYDRVLREVKDLQRALHERVDARKKELQLGLPAEIRTRLKLTTRELKATLKQATVMLERFYPSTLFPLIIVPPHPALPAADQQSRIDSGISTGGDGEEDGVSRGSLSCVGEAARHRGNTGAFNSLSLAGHGKNLAGASTRNTASEVRLARGRSEDSARMLHDASASAAGEAPEASSASGLERHGISFECSREQCSEAMPLGSSPSRGYSEERLLHESREVLLSPGDKGLRRGSLGRRVSSQQSEMTSMGEGSHKVSGQFSSEESWWDSRGLQPGDYPSLAALLFTEIFSADFLTPMDDEDTAFQIESSSVNLTRYTEMIRACPDRPDLDPLLTVHIPRGHSIHVAPPYLDLSCFTPLSRQATSHTYHSKGTKAALWGTHIAERLSLRARPHHSSASSKSGGEGGGAFDSPLMVPPPVPHPAVIAVIVHNREASEPLQLSCPDTRYVLRCMEESVRGEVGQYRRSRRGPWTADDTSGSSDSTPPSSPPSIDERASYSRCPDGGSRSATLPLSEVLQSPSVSGGRDPSSASPDSARHCLDSNPLRSLLESHPPFSVSLDLAPPEDPPANDYEDTLRTLHTTDSLESAGRGRSRHDPTPV